MSQTTRNWLILVALIAVLLGGADLIVQANGPVAPTSEVPAGFLH